MLLLGMLKVIGEAKVKIAALYCAGMECEAFRGVEAIAGSMEMFCLQSCHRGCLLFGPGKYE
jgi:hypothetical protein